MEKNIGTIPQMWSVKEAAEKTNTSVHFIRRLIADNKITCVATKRKYLINADSLCRYLTQGDKITNAETPNRG